MRLAPAGDSSECSLSSEERQRFLVRCSCVTSEHSLSIEEECSLGTSENRVRRIQSSPERAWLSSAFFTSWVMSASETNVVRHADRPLYKVRRARVTFSKISE